MGGLAFEDLSPSRIVSLRDFSRDFWAHNAKKPLIALDMSNHIMQVGTEARSREERISHQILVRRLAAMLKIGCALVGVFDGPLVEEKRRHRALLDSSSQPRPLRPDELAEISAMRQYGPMAQYARRACSALGIAQLEAPAEAEALCAWLQREGHVDAVFSADADVLANGATCVMRYLPHQHAANTKASSAEDRMLAIYELERSDAGRFAMMALLLGDDWVPGIPRIGKATASAISQPQTGFAARLVELVDLRAKHGPDFFGVELKRLQFHDEFAAELASNEHGWLARKQRTAIPESFPDIAQFERIMNPSKSYDAELVEACAEARISTGLLPAHKHRLAELAGLWTQPDPELEQSMHEFGMSELEMRLATRNRTQDERSGKLFRSTVAPLLVANLLMDRGAEAEMLEFKEARKGLDVEVVEAFPVSPFGTRFLFGARVARFIYDRCGRANPLQTAQRAKPAARRGSSQKSTADPDRDNSRITHYFAKRPREDSDTDDDDKRPRRTLHSRTERLGAEQTDANQTGYKPAETANEHAEEHLFVSDVEEPEYLGSSDREGRQPTNGPVGACEGLDESDIEVLEVNEIGKQLSG